MDRLALVGIALLVVALAYGWRNGAFAAAPGEEHRSKTRWLTGLIFASGVSMSVLGFTSLVGSNQTPVPNTTTSTTALRTTAAPTTTLPSTTTLASANATASGPATQTSASTTTATPTTALPSTTTLAPVDGTNLLGLEQIAGSRIQATTARLAGGYESPNAVVFEGGGSATFLLAGAYDRLTVTAAVPIDETRDIYMWIHGDGEELWSDNEVEIADGLIQLDLNVRGINQLRLGSTDWGAFGVRSVFADPLVYPAR